MPFTTTNLQKKIIRRNRKFEKFEISKN